MLSEKLPARYHIINDRLESPISQLAETSCSLNLQDLADSVHRSLCAAGRPGTPNPDTLMKAQHESTGQTPRSSIAALA